MDAGHIVEGLAVVGTAVAGVAAWLKERSKRQGHVEELDAEGDLERSRALTKMLDRLEHRKEKAEERADEADDTARHAIEAISAERTAFAEERAAMRGRIAKLERILLPLGKDVEECRRDRGAAIAERDSCTGLLNALWREHASLRNELGLPKAEPPKGITP